ncbi:putative WD repeat-containing protein alr3466 [Nostoc sp, PCC 7120] [Rhizoctonia solani]|uniref:Putative WD repeat-containing protein alr3466 [Nostoc sp, PCC 7120] n=1 Tax=Rhizoctonia solani TaxID=456999 RepID=A0A0K6FNY1_9AGAM|nr:putative WD repeat-containing protein alr3466 [Nostoc sp, PCC 7120] [Rhizoctonia solani]
MSADPPEATQFQHWITEVEVSPGNTDPYSKFSARIFVDEELICNLPWIDHTRPLRWSGLLRCNVSPFSKIALRLCKSVKEKPRYFNFPPVIVSEVDEETGESILELPEAVWVVTIKSLTYKMTEHLFPNELNKLDTIEGVYDDLDPVETVKYLFKPVLYFGKFIVEVLPEMTYKVSFMIYMKAWEVMDRQNRIDDTVQGILRGIKIIEDILVTVGRASSLTLPTAVDISKEVLADIVALLQEISIYILDRHAANDLVRKSLDESESSPASKVEAYLAQLEDLKNAFYALWPTTNISNPNPDDTLNNEPSGTLWKIVQSGADESTETEDPYEILSLLRPMDPSNYDPEQACLDGTRKVVLNRIVTWTQNRNHSESFMWISGQPGMGKTSIAASLCQQLDKINALAGSFFYRRDNADSNDPLRVINNLVHTIALKLPPYAHEVAKAIRADRGLCTSHFSLRYEGLVKGPLERLKSLSTPTTLVVIIDALDECENRDSSQKILHKLHEISRLVPWLRVIFTSRPERSIQEYFQKNCAHEPIFYLQDYDASEDIRAYIEVLSLLGRLDVATEGLPKLLSVELKGSDDWKTILSWIKDIGRFLLTFHDVIAASTPHLYISTLAFSPVESTTAQRMRPHFPKTVTVAHGGDLNWHPCIKTVLHPHAVQSFTISPDGLTVISGYHDGSLGIWNKQTGARIREPFLGHTDSVTCVVFSPKGNRVASSSNDATIRVWDVVGQLKTICVLTGHSGPVNSIAFSPSATVIASGSSDKTIRLWDPNVTRPISEPYTGHSSGVSSVAFSPDGTKLASGSLDNTIRVWSVDLDDPKLAAHPLIITGHSDAVTCVTFSPHGTMIASSSEDKTLQIWDVQSGSKVKSHTSPAAHSNSVTSVTFSPNGKLIASSSSSGALQLWDVTTLKAFSRPFGHTSCVNNVLFFPSGSQIISGSTDRTTRIWDIAACPKAIAGASLVGHSTPILAIGVSSDGTRIISVSSDQNVRIWDAQTGNLIGSPYSPTSQDRITNLKCVAIAPDGSWVMFVSGKIVKLWNSATRSIINSYQHDSVVACVTVSPDGTLVAFGCGSKACLWDVSRWKMFGGVMQASESIASVIFSPDGAYLATVGGSYIGLWDTRTQQRSSEPLSNLNHEGGLVALSPCGTQIASVSWNTVAVWDRKTGNYMRDMSARSTSSISLGTLTYSPAGSYLASGSRDGTIWLWDTKTGQSIGGPFAKHTSAINSTTFFPDGKYLITGSDDKSIQVWSLDPSYSGVEQTSNKSGNHCWPNNPKQLAAHPHHPGWVTHDKRSLVFWLPAHHQQPDQFLDAQMKPSRPSVFLDYKQFVHGTAWTDVVRKS